MSPAAVSTINGSAKIAAAAIAAARKDTGLCILEGALLRSPCVFPYLFLVAFEAGSIIRAFFLLLFYPLLLVASKIIADPWPLDRGLVMIAVAGLRASAVESVARAVLPKFFLEDLRWDCYSRFIGCKKRCVLATRIPRPIVEPFLREFLEVKQILGPELDVTSRGICTGMIVPPIGTTGIVADLGISSSIDQDLVRLCKDDYVVEANPHARPVPRKHYPKPLIFHDGRLAVRPTPAMALTVFLWLPIGISLAIPRALILVLCPNIPFILATEALLGIVMRYNGSPPPARIYPSRDGISRPAEGNLFVCSHRTLLDPVMLSGMVLRRVTAVTYSISWVSELLAPIRTVRLIRCRSHDARAISSHLRRGDLIVCPEGTTCREPYLLRFSKLFVEIADNVVPVAIDCETQLFHGTSVRGWKAMDPFFFALNPRPRYDITFLERVSLQEMADRGASSFEIANMIQQRIARSLGFQCTGFTRRDKYRLLLGEQPSSGRGRKCAGGGGFEFSDLKEDS